MQFATHTMNEWMNEWMNVYFSNFHETTYLTRTTKNTWKLVRLYKTVCFRLAPKFFTGLYYWWNVWKVKEQCIDKTITK